MQDKKREDKQKKDGVDFLIKQGYKKLSAKTFISDVDLEQFLNKDFTNINKTRALGFIQILEREYDVNLDELKEAYLEYERSSGHKEPETLFVETPIIDDKAWKKYLPYIVAALLFAGLGYYLLKPTVNEDENLEPLAKQLEENKSTIEKAEENIAKLNQDKIEVTDKNRTFLSVPDKNEDDLDLDKVVLQMMKERNISTNELNISMPDETNSSKIISKTDDKKDIEQNSTQELKTVTSKDGKKEKKEVKKQTQKIDNTEDKSKQKGKKYTKSTLYVEPLQKAWVGVIYLDNFQKKDFLIRGKLPLDASRDQLIVVGHKYFKIYNKDYSVRFTGRGPVRFIYKDGELMEISKKEFIKTSAGVAW